MKKSKLAAVIFLVLSLVQTACASERILDVRERRFVSREVLIERLAEADDVIVGEKHDTASVQGAEAKLFEDFAKARRSRVTFAWEFWNWSERAKLEREFSKFRSGETTSEGFLRAVFGDKNPELTYLPLMEAVKSAGAEVLATNLTRSEKTPVVQRGLGALDPNLLPPGFELGGEDYRERFLAEMGGHGKPEEVTNYFAAQSLVDDVAAYHFVEHRLTPSAFLVIGNFHTRYFDGIWKRIEKRGGVRTRLLVEVAEHSDENDWGAILNHPKYGSIADFLIFVR
jgi:uncharacterized iron-regulated protein